MNRSSLPPKNYLAQSVNSAKVGNCSGLNGGLQKICLSGTCHCAGIGEKVLVYVINSSISKSDHLGLSKWAPNPMKSILIRREDTDRRGEGHVKK